jgi:hypothetical protein
MTALIEEQLLRYTAEIPERLLEAIDQPARSWRG